MGLKIGRNKHQEDSSDDKQNNNGFEAVASSFGFMAQLRGSYTLKILFFFLQNNPVEQFWHGVKGLCPLTSKMSMSRSHATIVNE